MVDAFWGEIHGNEKHMSEESFVRNLSESWETKIQVPCVIKD